MHLWVSVVFQHLTMTEFYLPVFSATETGIFETISSFPDSIGTAATKEFVTALKKLLDRSSKADHHYLLLRGDFASILLSWTWKSSNIL
jgi:hypothetical protein